jgi:Zn-dependent protease
VALSPEFRDALYRIPALLIALMAHELSHALVALSCCDDTAKKAGRITLNPIRHIDPIGALLLIFARFGWAKPVPIDPDKFHRKRIGIIATSLAGPASNVIMAFIALFALFAPRAFWLRASVAETAGAAGGIDIVGILYGLLMEFYWINIFLASFNLLPIPPLDGSKALFSFLPDRIYYDYLLRFERYGMFVLIALSLTGVLGKFMSPVVIGLSDFVKWAVRRFI